jgi:hypothetical protein
MGLWRKKNPRISWTDQPNPVASPHLPAPRFAPLPLSYTYTHRREFTPGAPAFALATHGLPEYPVAAGYNNKFQFKVYQPPADIYVQHALGAGLGQSSNMQPPSPAAEYMYTQDAILALQQAAAAGIGLPPGNLGGP